MNETVSRDTMQVTTLVGLQSEFAGRRPRSLPSFRLGRDFSPSGTLPTCEVATEQLVDEYREQGLRPTKVTGLAVFTDGTPRAFKTEDVGASGNEEWSFSWLDQSR